MSHFEKFIEATRRRQETERLSRLHIDEEEETGVPENEPLFSVTDIARDRTSRYIASPILTFMHHNMDLSPPFLTPVNRVIQGLKTLRNCPRRPSEYRSAFSMTATK
jgi:hypothetical protein